MSTNTEKFSNYHLEWSVVSFFLLFKQCKSNLVADW